LKKVIMGVTDALLVVGGGHAGAQLAFSAREEGWAGEIVLIGDEREPPYQRPPLSKAYLADEIGARDLQIKSAAAYEKAGVRLRLGVAVMSIDRYACSVALSDGSALNYGRLALVTGGRPRLLPGEIAASATNLHYLRTLADVDCLRPQFQLGKRLVIIGGGYIGLEVASAAVKRGLQVTVLEAEERVLARVTAPLVSAFYERVHRAHGVDIRTRVAVTGFKVAAGSSDITEVECSNGDVLPVDLIVVGIGLLPNTELASAAGLVVDNGVVVDAHASTSDPLIVAAGDCTRFHSDLYGRSLRLESVPNAMEQARVAAATLCGKLKRHDPLPWFWSDQYNLKLKMVGLSAGYDQLVLRGQPASESFCAFYLQGSRVLAVDTVNRVPDFMHSKRLVAGRVDVTPELLADEAISLASLIPTHAAAS
jgi:3-phenylpropionate/trans-cinnamate dioxygenase ferredoxin reductase subunit